MSDYNNNIYYSGNESSPNLVEEPIGNKRQKLNNQQQQMDANDNSDFLNFDYNTIVDATANSATIPEDFFMFVTDNANIANSQSSIQSSSSGVASPQQQQQQLQQQPQPVQNNRRSSKQQQQQQQQQTPQNSDPPNQAVHTIVVGGRPFRLSWESLKSDGPSNFFLEYFRKRKTSKTMHIDRDPATFELIVRHLRGYYIRSQDDVQHQSLLCDATYYRLDRLKKTLQEHLYVNVGGRVFRLPWTLFQKDGTHNFFTGPLMHSLLSPHTEDGHSPPIYLDRDPDIFADIVKHLRGYTIHIRDEVHRKNLLKDAQYYVFRQLSDKLLTAQQTVAGFGDGSNPEVLLLLQDMRVVNMLPSQAMEQGKSYAVQDMTSARDWSLTQLRYKRIAEGPPHALLVQVSDLSLQIHKPAANATQLLFEMNELDLKKMKNMAHVAKAAQGVRMEIVLDSYCAITIDDNQVQSLQECIDQDLIETHWEPCEKQDHHECQMSRLILQRAICGVHAIDSMLTLCALRIECISSKYRLNLKRQFLSN
ncbi:hypothetical protein [Parasitella parasitica]|uniref:BTB domain-containing protein n=1 Tax=Parasitella parasitica TaxID=35722 RepID=A0A0B7MWU5_9FUNG|nr:hypothetical protein [Parasitella parasitica]